MAYSTRVSRRQLLKTTGAGLGMVGVSILSACSQPQAATPTAAATKAAATTAPTTAATTAAAATKAAATTAPAVVASPAASAATAVAGAKPLPKGTCTSRAMPETLAGDGALKGKTIKIGVEAPLTGDQARWGLEIQYSVEWVFEQINAKGGLLGAKLVSAPVDDQHTPRIGEAVAQKLIDDPEVMAVIGPYNSAVMMPTSLIYNKAKMASVAPTTSNPQITERGLNNVFRVCSRDDYAGRAGAVYGAENLKATKLAAIDDQTTFGKGVADEVEKKLKKTYPNISLIRTAIKAGDKDFRTVLGSLPKDIQGIYFGGYAPEGSLLVKQMKEVGLDKVPFFACEGIYSVEDFIKPAGGAGEGAATFAFAPPIEAVPESKPFNEAIAKRLGGVTAYANNSVDCAMIICAAIKRAGKLDRDAIRAEIAKTDNHCGFSSLDPIAFDSKGDNKNASVFVYVVKGNDFQFIDAIPNSKLAD